MEKQTKKCPVCGKSLTQEEYDKALGIWDDKHAQIKHLEKEQAELKKQAAILKKEKAEARRATKVAVAEQKRKFAAELRQHRASMKADLGKKFEAQTAKAVARGVAKQSQSLQKRMLEVSRSETKRKQLERSLKLALENDQKKQEEIKRLQEQLEKGITPQIEGLLEEGKLLTRLQELFPHDQFEHPGKGGDIIQTVMEQGKAAGKIASINVRG